MGCEFCFALTLLLFILSCLSAILTLSHQLEAFYSIFTTEQQDHVKSVEYLRSNFRPIQSLDNRHVFKSAVKDAWLPDLTDSGSGPYGTEASKGRSTESFSFRCIKLILSIHVLINKETSINTEPVTDTWI